MNDESYIHHLPYDGDLLDHLARLLLADPSQQPVDLSQHVVLFPAAGTRQRFRQKLLDVAEQQDVHALIPPLIASMESWLEQFRPGDKKILNHNEQELLLLQALSNYPHYLERYGTWPLIDSLLTLFQELTLNDVSISDDENIFRQTVESAYGAIDLAPLNDEAKLVHTLWTAWRADLQQQDMMDSATAHIAALNLCTLQLSPDIHLYLAGFQNFTTAEQRWIDSLGERGQIDVLAHGAMTPDKDSSQYERFLEAVFVSSEKPLLARSQQLKKSTPESPAADRLQVLEAGGLDQEARGIDIQVRRWLLQGKTNIGIVSNDRRLARRVRALQERANIILVDAAGWTLSTTSAASVIMRWLDCIETNFHFQSLFDFLASPFSVATEDRTRFQELVGHFEESAVYDAGVVSDLTRYTKTIQQQKNYIDEHAGEGTSTAILELLTNLSAAAQPWRSLVTAKEAMAEDYFNALHSSLSQLEMMQALENDDAGIGVLDEIESLRRCVAGVRHHINWRTFRAWLARNFERRKFKPLMDGGGVELMGFAESRLYQFDALIIGGATREHLPGSMASSPFFNESVRSQLNLPSGFQSQRQRLSDFQHLLRAAPQILITCSSDDGGTPLPKSPWLQQLQSFHNLTYGSTLLSVELLQLTHNTQTQLTSDTQALPAAENPPAVVSAADLLPPELSASSYQRLIDCPFRFFSSSNLGLRGVEEISDGLEKKDYGTKVHQILQAFHSDVQDLPGPFNKPLSRESIDAATALLTKISSAVFAPDIQHYPSAQGWLNLWQRVIPHYLAWQLQREQRWAVGETEHRVSRIIHTEPDIEIVGRIDRIDYGNGDSSLIDYKTGKAPTKTKITSGESIQLLFYALLTDKRPAEIMALELGDDGISTTSCLQGESLQLQINDELTRLQQVTNALVAGTVMPAWGDPATCHTCEFDGLCRRELWVEQT